MDRMSQPSPGEESRTLPQSLRDRLGVVRRIRCLSSRDHREIHLVEDSLGDRRIFKVCRQRDPDGLVRFQRVRELLKGVDAGSGLIPILDYGLEPVHGLAWEELPLADPIDPGEQPFENYSPVNLATRCPASAIGASEIGLSVVKALEFLHHRGLAHGDVKPANLLQLKGHWVLVDYDTVGEVLDARGITASTEGYCPPGGSGAADRDLYALGKLLYELWSGNTRLEYPSIPHRLTTAGTWSREDRLINRLVESLCHPVGLNRLRRMDVVRTVLEAVVSGQAADLSRAEALLRPRDRKGLKVTALVVAVLALGWVGLLRSGWLPRLPVLKTVRALFMAEPKPEPVEGLVAYYPFDGDAQDHSGRGHHGNSFKVTWVADASKTPSRAAHFNGESGVSIPEFPESETNAFSMVLWIRADQMMRGKLVIKDRAVGDRDTPGRQWDLSLSDEYLGGGVWARPQGEGVRLFSHGHRFDYATGRWIHAVLTWDGQQVRIWVDGDLVQSFPAQGVLAPGDSPVRIGWDQYYHFQGDIDEVRLYDRPLSKEEVQGIFRRGLRRAFHEWWASRGKP